ncbi:hypothetical protein KJ758_03855 [Patescibacteria group bacterium]|nr:hypothetical protein [Patescibacteria group bacterium]
MKKGWVGLHRCIEDWDLYFSEPFTKTQAWIDLFLGANHTDGSIHIRGNTVEIKRGQIGWSEITMTKRWKWSKNKVRRFLKWLETEQQIVQQKDRYITTIITILNYDNYQKDTADDTAERQQTIQQTIHKQEGKELKKKTLRPLVARPPQAHVAPILLYIKAKGMELTKGEETAELKRNLRAGKALKDYSSENICKAMVYCEWDSRDRSWDKKVYKYDWTLETVAKKIGGATSMELKHPNSILMLNKLKEYATTIFE